ncbi:putative transporter (transmembrane protein) [Balneicella halophila]|uniref:Putative transporter (Transmembrane protein) n=1 Tax=Balneicella halophila TaxID=1537566 RepID=A0A7L4UT32_BALHA|nr:mechanosensitive ion channel family protein [Balneicella halophila]PVX52447.1 putative transporter (transmembrane protein) [Balneicella halophila]
MSFDTALGKLSNSLENEWDTFIDQLPEILVAILIIIIGTFLARFTAKVFKKAIAFRSHDPLMTNFLTRVVKLIILILVLILALRIAGLGSIAAGLLTAAGAGAVILGFAFKDIGENFISGVILSFNRPFNLNDTVMVGDIFGKVKAMEFRYTKIKTFDGRDVYIPNSDIIKKAVFNYTEDGFSRSDFIVGIDYDDDIDMAKEVILKTVLDTPGVMHTNTHQTFIAVDSLGVSSVNLKVIFWTKTKDYKRSAVEIKSDVIKRVKTVVLENGLNMPADIHEIKLYGSQNSIPITVKKEEYKTNLSKKES